MQSTLNDIIKNYFSRDSLDLVTEAELEEYIRKYPYTSLGHFLLAKKRKMQGEDYQEAAARAVLYVNNPLWFEYLLNKPNDPLPGTNREIESPAAPGNYTDTYTPDHAHEAATPAEAKNPSLMPSAAVTASAPASQGSEPLFEPYHTIDYFASQGIRLRQADLEQDQFGRQLKSFTDWLKTMKRIGPPAPATPATHPPGREDVVEKTAINSIVIQDVDTEAMAEVWIKQGNTQKAIAIYHKLSLQNPSKSHYFADKIDTLKGN